MTKRGSKTGAPHVQEETPEPLMSLLGFRNEQNRARLEGHVPGKCRQLSRGQKGAALQKLAYNLCETAGLPRHHMLTHSWRDIDRKGTAEEAASPVKLQPRAALPACQSINTPAFAPGRPA